MGPGGERGGQILARTLILLIEEIDMIIASTDLAWVEASDTLPVFRGGRVRELSWEVLWVWSGRGGAAIANWFLGMKSGLGRDSRRLLEGKGVVWPLPTREGACEPLPNRRRLASGLIGEAGSSGRRSREVKSCRAGFPWPGIAGRCRKPGGCGTGGLPINRMKRLPLPPVEGVLSGNEPYPVIGVPGVAVPGVDKLGVDILLPPHFEQRDFSVLFVDAELEIELRPARRG